MGCIILTSVCTPPNPTQGGYVCGARSGGGNCRPGRLAVQLHGQRGSAQLLYQARSPGPRRKPFEEVTSWGVHNVLLSKKTTATLWELMGCS